jgi:hypothetical protein
MRAIASAKRLCSLTGAHCSIVWDWGDYRALFEDDTPWMPYGLPMDSEQDLIIPGYHHIRHLRQHEGGNKENRRVPITPYPRVVVSSWFVFGAAEEALFQARLYEEPVLEWFPKPHPLILEKVNAFKRDHFGPSTVGIHIRRTDHALAASRAPDAAYFEAADRLVDEGHRLFVATDNGKTLRLMEERYGDTVIHYPKSSALEERWPRDKWDLTDLIDDVADLWLLAACEFVIGSASSSYSRVAILLNGSPRCKAIDRRSGSIESIFNRIWSRARSALPTGALGKAPKTTVHRRV